ncbi:DUF3310 domain-containing protein [Streptomyces malaysiensis]|uniref:DUF3310 domain-containing protein n=1 Tax=Streptomyces malaysiensis TaxID=92644 RepID=UPI00367AAA44
MLRFKVGDRVVVTAPNGYEPGALVAGLHANRVGVIGTVNETDTLPYPYEVEFDGGGSLSFADNELVHEAEAQLAQVDLSLPPELDTRENDVVNHPSHYTWLPNGLEVIDITQNFGFVRGNALKYLFRADFKGRTVEDLKKARWYIDYEIKQLEAEANQ